MAAIRVLSITVLFLFLACLTPGALLAETAVHTFDCKNCHIPSLSVEQLGGGNVCLSCHDKTLGVLLGDGTTGSTNTAFNLIDASNAMGYNAGAVAGKGQTSHNWGAPDTQPRAGAVAPSRTLHPQFYSRFGSSQGKVTCSRCHNPHADRANPQLLVTGPGSAQQMCLACHTTWNQGSGMSNVTHPVNIDYAAAAAAHPGKYAAAPPEDDGNLNNPGQISLFDGKILCGSCHQTHFADSNATTADTPENFAALSLGGGDGKLLRANGAGRADKSGLCQTCHAYQAHGGVVGEKVGCMICHGGHAGDAALPNYYILRKNAATTTYGTIEGLDYSSPSVLDAGLKYTFWNDRTDGTANGYCEKCHGDAKTIGTGAGEYHHTTAVCTDCHNHGQAGGAFAASCNACHGMPPVASTTGPGGLVGSPGPTGSASPGAHVVHVTTKQYSCGSCHANSVGSGSTHNDGAPQSITIGFSLFNNAYRGGTYNGQTGVAYDSSQVDTTVTDSGAKTCTSIYCHGNYPGSGKNAIPQWNSSGTAACGSCHGSSNSDVPASGSHNMHAGSFKIACTACHSGVISGSSPGPYTVADQVKHADGKVDWTFNAADSRLQGSSERYNIASGASPPSDGTTPRAYSTCENIYCHSNVQPNGGIGKPDSYATPAWGTTGLTCNSCHKGGVHRDTGPLIDSGSHTVHLAYSAVSDNLSKCSICHSYVPGTANPGCISCHDVRNPGGSLADVFAKHVDGNVMIEFATKFGSSGIYSGTPEPGDGYGTCSNVSCHGSGTPQWGGTVTCGDCHAATAGTLTTGSHAGHLTRLNGPDGVVGTTLDCDGCHGSGAKLGTHTGHVNGVTTFADGNALAATNVCNTCHSPAGSYDGVNDPVVGAKDNWRTGIYTDGNLIAGKERWCVTCHDESSANSKADGTGVSARNMVGNNSTWGFYQTGHGANISVGCVQCHSTRMPHIDHIYTPILDVMKTTQNPNNYRFYVGKGMRMPYDRSSAPESREFCISCHSETNLFKNSGLPAAATSNFRSDYADGTGYQNLHMSYHREGSNCITCHDPHGTSAPRMTADDRIGKFRLTTLNAGDGKYYELSDRALWNSAANNHGGASTGSATGCGTCHSYVTLSAGASEPAMGMYQRLLVPISFLTVADLDADGLPDINDNCSAVSNVGQADTDGDGVGDACDNSPGGFDPSNRDRDYDGIGDVSDACPDDSNNDIDGDGVCIGDGFAAPKIGGNDNCPVDYNPTQADNDGDGHPDACDNCPSNANADQSDYDLDGIGDACDASCDSFRNVWSQFLYPPTGAFFGLALDASDNVYGAGYVRVTALPGLTYVGGYADFAIVKYDKNGTLLAKAELGSPNDGWEGFEDIAVDNANGFVYATGYTTGSLPGYTNLGSSDMVLAKYDAGLNQIWAKQIATAAYDQGFALAIDASGNLYVGAKISSQCTLVKYDPDGNELWKKPLGGSTIDSVAVDGAYVYAGGVQAGNAFVKQFGLDGTAGWSSQQGTAGTEADTSIVVTVGNVFVSGTTFGSFPGFTLEGTQDIFVLKLNKTDGSLMAATQFNAPDSQHARSIDTDSTGSELYVTGSSMSGFITQSPGIQWDAFLLSFDTDLNVLRRKQIADTGSNTNEDIAVSKLDGSIYMAGTRNSSSNFSLLKEQKGCP